MNIGQAASASGVSAKMIRYYERIGLIARAARSDANYRTYSDADAHTLEFIHRARALGFPLDAVRRLLTLWQDPSRSSQEVKAIALATIKSLRRKRDELEAMVGALEHLATHCQGDQRPNCPIMDDLATRAQLPQPPRDRRAAANREGARR